MLLKLENSSELELFLEENKNKPVLVDFYADWCGPCRMLLPVLDEIEKKHSEEFAIVKINVDHFPDLAAQFNVRSIPALFYVKNKEVVNNSVGFIDQNSLISKLKTL